MNTSNVSSSNQKQDKSTNQRRHFLIYPKLQHKLAFSYAIFGLIIICITLGFNYVFFQKLAELAADLPLEQAEYFDNVVTGVYQALTFSAIGSAFLILIISVFYGYFLSQKIAGPIHNIMQVLSRVVRGEKGLKITVRKNDYFHELADKLNEIITK